MRIGVSSLLALLSLSAACLQNPTPNDAFDVSVPQDHIELNDLSDEWIDVAAMDQSAVDRVEPMDTARAMDASIDDVNHLDIRRADRDWGEAGPPLAAPGCVSAPGFDCTGSFDEQCNPGCLESQCCVAHEGVFRCVDRSETGTCPVADLLVDRERMRATATVSWAFFLPNHCALVERCVRAPGWRRLLRFESTTANVGAADLFLGAPSVDRGFEFSLCHSHFHFTQYEHFALVSEDGMLRITGRKQGFCILDTYRYPSRVEAPGNYTCASQGLSTGWADVYVSGLDCQWLDVTDVPAGTYTLRSEVNPERVLPESDYGNNVAEISVVIPPDESALDPLRPCAMPDNSLARQCGWVNSGSYTCVPGAMTRAGCSVLCGLGSCSGDTILRVCPGNTPCSARDSLASNNDSSCSPRLCAAGGDCCSDTEFVCPPSGRVTVLTGARAAGAMAQCNVGVR